MSVQIVNTAFVGQVEPIAAWNGLGVRMPYAADEEIYAQEEEADLFYQVVRGSVRTIRLLSDGRRQIGDFYYPGDLFGFEEGPLHRLSAEAIGSCEILVVRRSALRQFGAADGSLERQLWTATSKALSRTQEHLLLLGRKTAAEKVAALLLSLADRFPGDMTDLPMGRQDMADYLGLTIETVSRMLTQMQADSLVRFESCRRFGILNRAALTVLATD
jgi:CRP/FNR family nitrogen fixation transcriptional regulator